MNTVTTTNADLKGNGTTSAWMKTSKNKIDDELIKEFYNHFPEIEKVHSLTLSSNKRDKFNLFIRLDFWKDW